VVVCLWLAGVYLNMLEPEIDVLKRVQTSPLQKFLEPENDPETPPERNERIGQLDCGSLAISGVGE